MVNTLIEKYPMQIKFSNGIEPYVTLRIRENMDAVKAIKEFLNQITEL